jgi:DNA polymerase I-like protein with 3'-5' exonuclease and polymerase domains
MVNYIIVESLDEITLNTTEPVFADIESDGLYVNTRLIQLYQPHTHETELPNKYPIYIIDTDIIDLNDAEKFLEPLWTIWHNASYDFGTLNMTTERFDDTQYLARTAYPEWQKFDLDTVVSKLGWNKLYADFNKKEMQKAGFVKGAYLSDRQLRYSATDVFALSQIWQNKRIQATREVLAYKVDIPSLKYSIEYQQNGLISHQPSVIKELEILEPKIAKLYEVLEGLNPNSPQQVCNYLGTDSSSKEVLIKIITEQGPLAKKAEAVYDQRRLLKRKTFLVQYNVPKCITRFNPAGAATGRFTSKGSKQLPNSINAQQIPRDLQYIFNTDTEDTVVIHADYSTAELRAGCSIMRDANMYKELIAGIDLHKIAATLAIGGNPENVTKAERQKGKAISFGFIFGMSAPSFVEYAFINYGVKFTLEEAKKVKAAYVKRYPDIAKYAKARWNDYKTTPVQTPLGRRNTPKLGTDAINYATQGCIAETMKLAIHYLCKDFPDATQYIYNVVHDAGYLRVPKGTEKVWAERLVAAMKKGWVEMCKRPMLFYKDIPMPVEVEYNDYSTGKAVYTCIEE